jgi:hypothetical protein
MKFYQLDNDTKKYIKRLNYNGIKTPSDIYSVDQFIRGLKDMGIWKNIACWTFRANQNAGSGVTAYSFGNLGSYNGTLTGSPIPIWTANGLVAQSTNSFVQTNLAITLSSIGEFSMIGVGSMPSGSPARLLGANTAMTYIYGISGATSNYSFYDFVNNLSITNSADQRIINWVCLTKNTNLNTTGYVNNGSGYDQTLASLRSTSDNLAFFGSSGTADKGVYPFFAFLNIQLSSAQNSQLYSLYKTTAGKGLVLP